MCGFINSRWGLLFLFFLFLPFGHVVLATEIGGRTAAQGTFVLDNFEDLNIAAIGVGRNWIPDSQGSCVIDSATTNGLTLAAGQTPAGALHYTAKEKFDFISAAFGVPMPSTWGASTLTNPGNLANFDQLVFTSCATSIPNATYQLILECYPQWPDNTFPTMYWNFSPPLGTTYEPTYIDLHQPALVERDGGRTVDQLLSQTRYFSFYVFVYPALKNAKVTIHVDDVQLLPTGVPLSQADGNWQFYH